MKRMAWAIVAIAAFVIIGHVMPAMADGNSRASSPKAEAEFLSQSFQATGAKVNGFLIHDYSTVNHQFMSLSDLQHLAEVMATDLRLSSMKGGQRSGQGEHIFELSGTWSKQIDVSIVLSSFHMTDGMPDSTLLVLRAKSGAHDLSELQPRMSAISNELKRLHIGPQLDAYISGYVQPKLSQGQTDRTVSDAFDAVQAKRTEGLTSELVTSISGYSPQDPTYILSNGKKMNLQVALHWNEYDRHTNIIVGAPFIVDPY